MTPKKPTRSRSTRRPAAQHPRSAAKPTRASASRSRSPRRSRPIVDGAAGLRRKLAERKSKPERYLLRLYLTGMTPGSQRAIERVREICERRLRGRYRLDVVDIFQLPALARDEQIIATPTLIKVLPAPLRRFIGDLSNVESILLGLDVREAD